MVFPSVPVRRFSTQRGFQKAKTFLTSIPEQMQPETQLSSGEARQMALNAYFQPEKNIVRPEKRAAIISASEAHDFLNRGYLAKKS